MAGCIGVATSLASWLQCCSYLCSCGSPWTCLQNHVNHPLSTISSYSKLWRPQRTAEASRCRNSLYFQQRRQILKVVNHSQSITSYVCFSCYIRSPLHASYPFLLSYLMTAISTVELVAHLMCSCVVLQNNCTRTISFPMQSYCMCAFVDNNSVIIADMGSQ